MSDDQAPETAVKKAKPAKGASSGPLRPMPRPATLDHLRSRKKPQSGYVDIVLDPDLADAYNAAKYRFGVAEMQAEAAPDNLDVQEELAAASVALDEERSQLVEGDGIVRFRLSSLSMPAFDALVLAHPPTKDQRSAARAAGERVSYNNDTFPVALLAACLTEPQLSEAEVEILFKDPNWSQADLQALFDKALEVNTTRRVVDLGKG